MWPFYLVHSTIYRNQRTGFKRFGKLAGLYEPTAPSLPRSFVEPRQPWTAMLRVGSITQAHSNWSGSSSKTV
jgi:hypothetical protein